jgi:excisionase family DNA binding protein
VTEVRFELSADVVEAIAERAAEIVLERVATSAAASPYMTVPEAAEFLRAKRQRVDDLLSSGRLSRFKDGSRTLVSRAELEAYVEGRP